jgi:hypothetical protein
MKFKLEINCNHGPMTVVPERETAIILTAVADRVRSGLVSMSLRDSSGLEVGRAEFVELDDDGRGPA